MTALTVPNTSLRFANLKTMKNTISKNNQICSVRCVASSARLIFSWKLTCNATVRKNSFANSKVVARALQWNMIIWLIKNGHTELAKVFHAKGAIKFFVRGSSDEIMKKPSTALSKSSYSEISDSCQIQGISEYLLYFSLATTGVLNPKIFFTGTTKVAIVVSAANISTTTANGKITSITTRKSSRICIVRSVAPKVPQNTIWNVTWNDMARFSTFAIIRDAEKDLQWNMMLEFILDERTRTCSNNRLYQSVAVQSLCIRNQDRNIKFSNIRYCRKISKVWLVKQLEF